MRSTFLRMDRCDVSSPADGDALFGGVGDDGPLCDCGVDRPLVSLDWGVVSRELRCSIDGLRVSRAQLACPAGTGGGAVVGMSDTAAFSCVGDKFLLEKKRKAQT